MSLSRSPIRNTHSLAYKVGQLLEQKGIKRPVLLIRSVSPDGVTVSAWCPFCRAEHTHGNGGGHRVAHCAEKNSPFMETGYLLMAPAELVKTMKPEHQTEWRGYTIRSGRLA